MIRKHISPSVVHKSVQRKQKGGVKSILLWQSCENRVLQDHSLNMTQCILGWEGPVAIAQWFGQQFPSLAEGTKPRFDLFFFFLAGPFNTYFFNSNNPVV